MLKVPKNLSRVCLGSDNSAKELFSILRLLINESRLKCSESSYSRTRAARDGSSDGANSKAAIGACSWPLSSKWLNMCFGAMSSDTRKSQSNCLILAAAT